MSIKLFNKKNFLKQPKLPSTDVVDSTKDEFWEPIKIKEVDEYVRITKEDIDGSERITTDIHISNDSNPDSILYAIKENAKGWKGKWDRITCQYIVNEDVRKTIEINCESSTKFIETVEMLKEFLNFILGLDE